LKKGNLAELGNLAMETARKVAGECIF